MCIYIYICMYICIYVCVYMYTSVWSRHPILACNAHIICALRYYICTSRHKLIYNSFYDRIWSFYNQKSMMFVILTSTCFKKDFDLSSFQDSTVFGDVYLCVCVCVCVCVCTYVYTYINIGIHIHIHIIIHTYIYIYKYYIYEHIYIYNVYIYIYIYSVYEHIYIYTWTYVFMHIYIYVHIFLFIHNYVHVVHMCKLGVPTALQPYG